MKTRIVLAGLLVSMMVVEVSAQRAEYDDMYFRGKDRETNKAVDAEEAYASAKTKKQKPDEVAVEEKDNLNPTDSYSARNVNPEYVSRSNSEKASEDETNYYLEGYTPAAATSNFNNSYYNNANAANSSYYVNSGLSSPYYGTCGCNPYMGPTYGYGPSSGWSSGWSISFIYGNSWSPYGGYGMYSPYYGGYSNPYYGGGYGYPGYYGGNNYYNEAPRVVNYGKRPSRHSAVVQPTERTRTRDAGAGNVTRVSSSERPRQRQVQDEYYVRPARRTSTLGIDNLTQRNSGSRGNDIDWFTPSAQPSRSRDNSSSHTPSYTPSSSPSPSRGSSGGSSGGGGGGGSSPRPRGRN